MPVRGSTERAPHEMHWSVMLGFRRSSLLGLSIVALSFTTQVSRAATTSAPPPPSEGSTSTWGQSARGMAIGAYFGGAQGNFAVGGQITSPWFINVLRVNLAAGPAFYSGALASDLDATWTPFGLGHLRLEAGPDFFRGAAVRPYSFGGFLMAVLPDSISEDGVVVGGLGGIGLEVGHLVPGDRIGNVTYGFEIAGVGSGAKAETPTGRDPFLSGLLVNASIRGYLW